MKLTMITTALDAIRTGNCLLCILVCAKMYNHGPFLRKTFSALLASAWFLFSVCAKMNNNRPFLRETFSALLASVWFLSCVCEDAKPCVVSEKNILRIVGKCMVSHLCVWEDA